MPLKTTEAFSTAYKKLNAAQKIAVDTTEGPVLVVAGPGTGKTQVLAARIANILLKTDSNPYNILALTFTDSAAKNMRERVVQMIGQAGYYVHITTFHSLCASIIKSHPEYFPIDRESQPLTNIERYTLLENILTSQNLDILKPINRPLFYIKDILRAISDLKREGLSVDEFAQIVEKDLGTLPEDIKKSELLKLQKQQQKNRELATIYKDYEDQLRESLRYDFDDMISLVVAAFEHNEDFLQQYQEQFQYILVDEFQDTNSAQNKIVNLLASFWGEQANVFVVGDPHQSIYRFQGASVENIYGFIDTYKSAVVVTLTEGYRCPQIIYDAAHALITHNTLTALDGNTHREQLVGSLSQLLHSANSTQLNPELLVAPSQLLELVQVAEDVATLIKDGVPAQDIAILYRTNAEAAQIQQVLERWNIAYEIDGGSDVLQNEVTCELLELCTVIDALRSGGDGHQLFEVLGYPWLDLDSSIVFRIARAAGKCEVSIYELLRKGYDYYVNCDPGTPVTPQQFQPFTEFIAKLEAWAILDSHVTFPEWFETVLNESGLLSWIKQQDNKIELLLNINALFGEIKKLAHGNREIKLTQFLSAITVMREHGIAIQPEDLNVSEGAVQLATVHKAKGREWDYVFIVHCIDGKWGNRRNVDLIPLPPSLLKFSDISKKERNEDERRLFYVALTRAKKQVICCYPTTVISENRSQDVVGSMFLLEVGQFLKPKKESSLSYVNKEEEYLERLVAAAQPKYTQSSEKEFFKKLVDELKLSVTVLNDYLRDPEYFVTYRLLKVPQAKPSFLAYGTAIHFALEKMYSYRQKQGVCLPEPKFLKAYEYALQKELLTADEFSRRLEKGKIILSEYYNHVCEEEVQPIYIEKFFGSGFSHTRLGDIPLLGRVDRIDLLDTEKKLVKVVDYKTGRVQSANEIEGKTISAGLSEREQSLPEPIRGPYKRQLLFYKLLTELDSTFNQTVTQGTFEFIEPSKTSQKFVRREFDLYQKDVDLLKELVREVMSEIRNLKFLQ